MSKITNPDGCSSCFPCLSTTDVGCDCPSDCHDPRSYDADNNGNNVPDRLEWEEGSFTVVPDQFHLVLTLGTSSKLVETAAEFIEYATLNNCDPSELLAQLASSGRLSDAPASLIDQLTKLGKLRVEHGPFGDHYVVPSEADRG